MRATAAWADQLIIEPEMGRAPIVHAIQQAQHSIDLVMYGFTDDTLLNAILQKQAQGKTVKIILERAPYKTTDENKRTISQFKKHQLAWQGTLPAARLIHQKTLILDGRTAMVMTFNFTHSTFQKQRNFAVVIDDPREVKAIAALFAADWNHVPFHNTAPDLIVSPDDSREKLLSLIESAKTSIQLYAQSLSDYQLVGALAKAAKRGVQVQVLTSSKLREKQQAYLTAAGVHIGNSKKLYIHAKALLIDGQQAAIGSINLTRASLDKNRELMVVTRDKQVINPFLATFAQDWEEQPLPAQSWKQPLLPHSQNLRQALRFLRQITELANF
jgi:cardiolipin synthase